MENKKCYDDKINDSFDVLRKNLNEKFLSSSLIWNCFDKEVKDLEMIGNEIMAISTFANAREVSELEYLFDIYRTFERSEDEEKICTALRVFSEGKVHNFDNSSCVVNVN